MNFEPFKKLNQMDESKQSVTSSDGKTTEEIIKLTLGLEMILKNNDVYYQVIKAMEEYASQFQSNITPTNLDEMDRKATEQIERETTESLRAFIDKKMDF